MVVWRWHSRIECLARAVDPRIAPETEALLVPSNTLLIHSKCTYMNIYVLHSRPRRVDPFHDTLRTAVVQDGATDRDLHMIGADLEMAVQDPFATRIGQC